MKTSVKKLKNGNLSFEAKDLKSKEDLIDSLAEIQMKIWESQGISVEDGLRDLIKECGGGIENVKRC